jgi:hypothetical protein
MTGIKNWGRERNGKEWEKWWKTRKNGEKWVEMGKNSLN